MRDFLTALFQCSISMVLVTLLYTAILPLLAKRYTAKWLYIVWLVIAVGWLFPFRPRITLSLLPAQMDAISITPVQQMIGVIPYAADTENIASSHAASPLWLWLAVIWAIGAVSVVAFYALRHYRFMRILRRWSEPVTDENTLRVFDRVKAEMKIKPQIGLSVCQSIASPMLVGFFRPVIVLPPVTIAGDALFLILKHELVHYKRHDLWYKMLILAAAAIHWFNPAVYLMAKMTAVQCEISCDALALQGVNVQQRRQYGETIISVVKNGAKLRTALSTNFFGGRRGMRNRMVSIVDTKRKKGGAAILCFVLAWIIITGITLTAAADNGESDTLSDGMYMVGTMDGKNNMYTEDGGKTWMTEAEYKEKNPGFTNEDALTFWEPEEFEKWMEQEKLVYQELVDEGQLFYDKETNQWRTYTQQDVDALYQIWLKELERMKQGYRYTKTIELPNGGALAGIFEPDTAVGSSTSAAIIALGDGTTVNLGNFDTAEDAEAAVKKYLEEQVNAGAMTQQEANEALKDEAIE